MVVRVTWWCKVCGAPGSIVSNTRKWSREGQTITDTSSPGHGDSAQPGVKSPDRIYLSWLKDGTWSLGAVSGVGVMLAPAL